MSLLTLPTLLIPKAPNPKTATQADLVKWMVGASQALQQFQQGLEAVESFIADNAQLATGIIEADNIKAGIITADLISTTGAIITQTIQVQDAIITNAKIVNLEGGKIDADSITATQIAASAITTTELAASAILATHITASAVIASKIAAGAVLAGKIDVAELSAISADMGTLTAGVIQGGLIRSGQTAAAHTVLSPLGVQIFDGVGRTVATFSSASNTLNLTTAGGKIHLEGGADIVMTAMSNDPAEIRFQTSNGVEIAKISGAIAGGGALHLYPITGTGAIEIGSAALPWNVMNLYANTALTLDAVRTIQIVSASSRIYVNWVPGSNNLYTLGDSTNARWKGIFLNTGSINITTGAASTANTLANGAVSVPTACDGTIHFSLGGTTIRIPFYF